MESQYRITDFVGRFPLGAIDVRSLVGTVAVQEDGTLRLRIDSQESSEFWLECSLTRSSLQELFLDRRGCSDEPHKRQP
jgi:hypothetical protein